MTAERTLELPALGRPMQLGMLYDCRSDTPIPGITLWDPAILHDDCKDDPKPGTQFSIIVSDGVEDKASALNVEAELKASFLGGLVVVQGSAKYLNDTKTSEHQSRLTLHYEATTRFEQLTMKHLGRHNVQHADVFDQGTATHVVTGILYGAKAFFVFDRDCTIEEKLKDVQGNLHVLVKKIPLLEIKGSGSVKLSSEEKKEQTNIRCTFYGDFALGANPSNVEEAIEVYKQLPTMLGKNGENAVPMRVWLYPLAKLDDRSAKMVREITVNLISDSQSILEGLDQMQVKCDDAKTHQICTDFPQFVDNIDTLKELLLRKKLSFRQFLARVLPRIRGGSVQESKLHQAVVDFEQCPFNLKQVGNWLRSKGKEMSVVKAYMRSFKGVKIISSRADLEALVLDPLTEHIVCFAFPCIGHDDKYLTVLSQHLKSNEADSESYIPANKGWFNDVSASKITRRYAGSFVEFYQANLTNTKTIFAVTGFDDGDKATVGGSMFLYKYGVLTTKTFEPPGKPVKLIVSGKSHDSVSLEWQPPIRGVSELQHYVVKYREVAVPQSGSTDWTELKTDGAERQITVVGLNPFTSCEFKVVSVCNAGVSQDSETTSSKTCPTSPPTQLRKHRASESSISIVWSKPSQIGKDLIINNYLVKYRPASGLSESRVHKKVETTDQSCFFTVDDLHVDTRYEFLVSAICSGSVTGAESDMIEIVTRPSQKTERYAQRIGKISHVLSQGCVAKGEPATLQLPLDKPLKSNATYRSYSFGRKSGTCPSQHKVIMLVGATGAGKSTLIDSMVNYILQIEWEDGFRFKIVDDQADGTSKSQAHSQTQIITSYTIYKNTNHSIPYTLTIIDTPGFGDTRGVERDRAIVDLIRDFFSHSDTHQIDHIDAIGFVAQASMVRLTHTQKYVFDSILSVFGKDISPNILLLVTFADGQTPPLTAAVRAARIPCSDEIFKFNNSALFANIKVTSTGSVMDDLCDGGSEEVDDANNFDKMFWRMGLNSMMKFFIALGKLDPRSLSLTKEVLDERKRLEVSLEGLQPQIQIGVCKIEGLRLEHQILEQYEKAIEATKDFCYEVEVPKRKQIDIPGTGNYITNCSKCHFTCHFPCAIADDMDKSGCWAMTDGICRVCPGKCIWDVHFNQQYGYEYYTEKEQRKYTQLEERYRDATCKKLTVEQVICKQQEEFEEVLESVALLVTRSLDSLKRLEEIALRQNPLSTVEYVDLLIESEKIEAESGWQSRVRALQDIRKQADIMSKVKQGKYNPLGFHTKELQMTKGNP
ncbi:LOW QUALITY PROTEIN: uncharacterized protein [Asterias amurensis]|uniref:LOW QUALITY PROTEIN: uncharacterized protein n=1 Tax=Asterias amurensis TaxID=7602 RepID=UPI003AB2B9D5